MSAMFGSVRSDGMLALRFRRSVPPSSGRRMNPSMELAPASLPPILPEDGGTERLHFGGY